VEFTGSDPPVVGDKKQAYGMQINGQEINKSASPEHMCPHHDTDKLYNTPVNIMLLLGMFNLGISSSRGDNLYDKAQRTKEMAPMLLSIAIGWKAQIHNSLWKNSLRKTKKQHGMQQIKAPDSLYNFLKSASKTKSPACEQQDNAIQIFMSARQYDPKDIENYKIKASFHGLTPHIPLPFGSSLSQLPTGL
jgi:hypothetical protein